MHGHAERSDRHVDQQALRLNFPKPLACGMVFTKIIVFTAVFGVFLPILHVMVLQTTHEPLQFLKVKDRQWPFWNNIKESQQQFIELWLDTIQQCVLEHASKIRASCHC
jgi:hypothetical protein